MPNLQLDEATNQVFVENGANFFQIQKLLFEKFAQVAGLSADIEMLGWFYQGAQLVAAEKFNVESVPRFLITNSEEKQSVLADITFEPKDKT